MEKAVVVAGGRSKGGKAQLRAVLTSAMQGGDACLVGVRAWCLMPGSGALLRYGRWAYLDGGRCRSFLRSSRAPKEASPTTCIRRDRSSGTPSARLDYCRCWRCRLSRCLRV
jgi:hypothetical protein